MGDRKTPQEIALEIEMGERKRKSRWVPRRDRSDNIIGYWIKTGRDIQYIPIEELNKSANDDWDGVVKRFRGENKTSDELISEQNVLLKEMEKLSSYQYMNAREKADLLISARKTFNRFQTYADTVFIPQQIENMQSRFTEFVSRLNQYTDLKVDWKPLDLKSYRATIGAQKSAELAENLRRGLFGYTQRITLFDLYKKGNLQQETIKYALGKLGSGMDYNQQIDEIMATLNRVYPAGYIPVPVTRVGKGGTQVDRKETRKLSLDTYIKTWISDINATYDNAVMENAYMQAGIDLVIMRNEGPDACDICAADKDKIFSLSGKDPSVPIAPYRPAHPNCDCYLEPVLTQDFWKKNPLTEKQVKAFRDNMDKNFKDYQAKTPRKLEEKPAKMPKGIDVMPATLDDSNYDMEKDKGSTAPFDNLLKIVPNSDIILYKEKIKAAITNGELDLSIRKEKQKQHSGTGPKWKSILTVDAQELVDKYAGTGEYELSASGVWKHNERVVCEDVIGDWIEHGDKIPSKVAQIHYSTKGTHVYPVNPNKGVKND